MPLVRAELAARVEKALETGVAQDSLVLDPGFGFGKRGDANYALLAGLRDLQALGLPVLVGVSRKGFLAGAAAGMRGGGLRTAENQLIATVAANTAAVLGGANLLRVHDVRAAVAGAAVADAVLAAQTDPYYK